MSFEMGKWLEAHEKAHLRKRTHQAQSQNEPEIKITSAGRKNDAIAKLPGGAKNPKIKEKVGLFGVERPPKGGAVKEI